MTKGRKGAILICVTFLVLAGWLLVEKKLLSIPKYFSYHAKLDTSIQHFDIDTGKLIDTTLARSQVSFQFFPTSDKHNKVSASLVTWKQNGVTLSETNNEYRIENYSWTKKRDKDEIALLFAPRAAVPDNFQYRHISLPTSINLQFDKIESINELALARYSGRYSSQHKEMINSGSYTVWFEPVSGYPVKYQDEKQVYLTMGKGNPVLWKKTLSNYTDIAANNHLRQARYYKRRVTVANILGPVTVVVSLILLALYTYSLRTFGWVSLGFAALITMSAFIAWLLETRDLPAQAHQTLFPLNTGLAILLSSFALFFISVGNLGAGRFLSLIALALPLSAIVEYMTGANLRLNLQPVGSYTDSALSLTGQTSLNSAICLFSLAGILFGNTFRLRPHALSLGKFILSGIFAYALIAYVDHLVGLEGTYAWNEATRMTAWGAGALILLILAYTAIGIPEPKPASRHHFSFSVVIIGLVISIVLWLALTQKEHNNMEEAMEIYASKFHHTLISEISQRDSALKRKAARWMMDPGPSFQQSSIDAENYFNEIGGYELFVRLDSEHHPIWTYPENYSGGSLAEKLQDKSFTRLLNLAKTERKAIHSSLFTTAGNEYIVASIYPLWKDQDFFGYFVGFISISAILDDTIQQYAGGEMDIQVKSGQKLIYAQNTPFTDRPASYVRDFTVQWNDIVFLVRLIPAPSYLEKFYTALPSLVLGAGFCFSFLTGISVWLYGDRNRRLVEVNSEVRARKNVQQRLENMISHSPNGILLVSSDGEIQLANNAIEQMFGYSESELIGKKIDLLVPQQFMVQHGTYLTEYLNEPSPRKMGEGREVFGVRKNGEEFPVEIGLAPTELEGDIQIICSIVDISNLRKSAQQLLKTQDALMNLLIDTKQAQIALENKQNELKATNKELEQFAYVASHDLQEPLRKLISFSKLLPQDIGTELSENARKDLFFIEDAAERMRSLVQDLLTLSRAGINALSISECDLDTIVNDVLSILSSTIEESGAEITRVPLPKIRCDRRLITQLYQNLISNALKFVPAGTKPKIEITLEKGKGDEPVFGVKDNGIGIKPHHRERIFMPFKRLHSSKEYKGTGIGLSICKKAVERHGGTIWVESGEEGTHFKFTLGKSA